MAESENINKNVAEKKQVEEALVIQFVDDENENNDIPGTEDDKVSLEKLAEWKASGNYEMLELYIRKGSLEVLPKEELFQLVLKNREHQIFVKTLKSVLLSFQPLLEKQEQLSVYIDPDSKIKINIGKLMEELLRVQNLNPFSKKESRPLPVISLFQNAISVEELKGIDVDGLNLTLKNNEIDFRPFIQFIYDLGLIPQIPQKQID